MSVEQLPTGNDLVHNDYCPNPDPVRPAKAYEKTEPPHQEIECHQEQEHWNHKPECRYDQLLGSLAACL